MPQDIDSKETKKRVGFKKIFIPYFYEGNYQLQIKQHVEITEDQNPAGFDTIEDKLDFSIHYDRFHLSMADIHSVYPAQYSSSDYRERIPQITFYRESIPWERRLAINDDPTLNGKYVKETLPWMALFLFQEEDKVLVRKLKIKEAFDENVNKGKGIFTPKGILKYDAGGKIQHQLEESDETECTVVDIPVVLFTKMMPTVRSLELSAHIRCVDVEDKETKLFVTDGRFSGLIGNRLPGADKTDPTVSVNHEAHVVSLEGFDEYLSCRQLKDKNGQLGNYQYVRMISLYQWPFFCKPTSDHTFGELVMNLDLDYFANHMDKGPITDGLKKEISSILKVGYRPLNQLTREGNRTVSWYRSPLLPYLPEFTCNEKNLYSQYSCQNQADAALAYFKNVHMLDTSYSAAWSLGRLLGLKNRAYLGSLYQLRLRNYEKDAKLKNVNMMRDILDENRVNDSNEKNMVLKIAKKSPKRMENGKAIKEMQKELISQVRFGCKELFDRAFENNENMVREPEFMTADAKNPRDERMSMKDFLEGINKGELAGDYSLKG